MTLMDTEPYMYKGQPRSLFGETCEAGVDRDGLYDICGDPAVAWVTDPERTEGYEPWPACEEHR